MADIGVVKMDVRIRDMDRTRLFVYQLQQLVDQTRVEGGVTGPVAVYRERLESLLDRYIEGGDDEGVGDPVLADEMTVTVEESFPCPNCGHVEPAP